MAAADFSKSPVHVVESLAQGIAAEVVLTAATGTPSTTITDVGGAFNQATLNNNFKSLADKLNNVINLLKA